MPGGSGDTVGWKKGMLGVARFYQLRDEFEGESGNFGILQKREGRMMIRPYKRNLVRGTV